MPDQSAALHRRSPNVLYLDDVVQLSFGFPVRVVGFSGDGVQVRALYRYQGDSEWTVSWKDASGVAGDA